MNAKRMSRAAVMAAGAGMSALMICAGPVSADPQDPPPSPTSPPAPGQPGGIALPHTGGSQHGGHGSTQDPQPGTP